MSRIQEFLILAAAAGLALFGLFYAPRINRILLFAILLVTGGLAVVALVSVALHIWEPLLRL